MSGSAEIVTGLNTMFSMNGRRQRMSYFWCTSFFVLPIIALFVLVLVLGLNVEDLEDPPLWFNDLVGFLAGSVIFSTMLGHLFLVAQRTRDIGWNVSVVVGLLLFLAGFDIATTDWNTGRHGKVSDLSTLTQGAIGLLLLFVPGQKIPEPEGSPESRAVHPWSRAGPNPSSSRGRAGDPGRRGAPDSETRQTVRRSAT